MIRFLRFCVVGTVGFIVDAGVLSVLLPFQDPYSARVLSYLVAASVTWILNRHYTFSDCDESVTGETKTFDNRLSQWFKYIVANGIGAGVNYAVYVVCLLSYDTFKTHPVLGVAVGSIAGLIFNFTASRNWVFRNA